MTQHEADREREQKASQSRRWQEQVLVVVQSLWALVTVVYIIGHFVIKFW